MPPKDTINRFDLQESGDFGGCLTVTTLRKTIITKSLFRQKQQVLFGANSPNRKHLHSYQKHILGLIVENMKGNLKMINQMVKGP